MDVFIFLLVSLTNYKTDTSIMTRKLLFLFALFLITTIEAQTFSGTTGTVSDDGQINEFTVAVSGLSSSTLSASLGVIQVCLDITHTYDSDLNIALIAPDGTSVNLFSGIGGGDDNFTNTCLNQSATSSINEGFAPFTGTFKPQETLGNCNNGQNGNGLWKLRIVDTYPTDFGIVTNWSLTFGSGAAIPFVFTSSNLPIVIINTQNIAIPNEPAITGTMKIIDNGSNTNYTSDFPNNYNGTINIELRGSYSQSLPQKPYKIETLDASNASVNVPLLGMPAEHDWNLISNYNDKVFVRNTLAYKLFNEMGHYSARSRFCEVILNGSYQGVYLLMESIKRDQNRVAIAKLEPTENSGIDLTGGYIIKNDYWDSSTGWLLNYHPIDHPELDVHLVYDYPKPSTISPEQQTYIQTFITNFETALYSTNYADPINGYNKYINTASFIDYFIVNELARNNDGFKKSSYYYKDKDSATAIAKLNAGPVWDFDWAWKNINECSIFAATDGSGWAHHINDCGPDVNSPGWYIRLLQDANFQNDLRCRWENLRATILSNDNLNAYIDTQALYLNEAQSRHFEKWGNLGINTGTPEVDADPSTFPEQITKFKNWIALRLAWLDSNIPGNTNNCSLSVTHPEQGKMIKLFPNPAKDQLYLTFEEDTNAPDTLTVYDITGKIVLYKNRFLPKTVINISNIANGIYTCKLSKNKTILAIKKIVVLH